MLGLIPTNPHIVGTGTEHNMTVENTIGGIPAGTYTTLFFVTDISESLCKTQTANDNAWNSGTVTDDEGNSYTGVCMEDTRQSTFFGNIIGNIQDLGWFNAILFGPLLLVIAWLIISGPKVAGSGWDGGV
jgi:hypothetical protein